MILILSIFLQIFPKTGLSEEDKEKIIALKQFIFKASKSMNRSHQSHPISLKDLGVTPYTMFLNPPNFSKNVDMVPHIVISSIYNFRA